MAASLNRGSGDPVVLLLEGPCGMDQDLCLALFQKALEVAVVGVDRQRVFVAETQLLDRFERAISAAATY